MFQYIEQRLSEFAVKFTMRTFSRSDTYNSFSGCIDAEIPGKIKDTLIVILPTNNIGSRNGNRDTLINVALGLSLIRELGSGIPDITLRFIFMGAEFGESQDYPLGSRIFLDDFYPDYKAVVLYCNLRDIPKRILLQTAGNGIVSPYWLILRCASAMQKKNLPFLFQDNKNQLFRMGFSDDRTKIEPYLKSGIPSLCIEGEYDDPRPSENKNWVSNYYGFFVEFIKQLSSGFPQEWDKHFLFFQLFNSFIIFNEQILIIITIIILLIFFTIVIILSNYSKHLLQKAVKKWWILFFFLPVSFVFFLISSFLIDCFVFVKGNALFWETSPFAFLLFKLFFTGLVYASIMPLLGKIPFPKGNMFYEKWALFFLLIIIIIFSMINVSYTYYFVWAFALVLISLLFKNVFVRCALFLLSPFWLIKLAFDFFITFPEYRFCRTLLINPFFGNFLLALCLTPFMLLGSSGLILLRPHMLQYVHKLKNASVISMSVIIALLIGYMTILPDFTSKNPQQVAVVNIIDLSEKTNSIVVSSKTPIGKMSISDGDENYNINTNARKYTIPKEKVIDIMSYSLRNDVFLDRKNITLTLSIKGKPNKIQCSFESKDDLLLYDSNFPFKKLRDGRLYELEIGVNPDIPLTIQVTVPQNMKMICTLSIDYETFPYRFITSGTNKNIRTIMSVKNTIEIL